MIRTIREILIDYSGNPDVLILNTIEDPMAMGIVFGVRTNIGDFVVNVDEGVDSVMEGELNKYFGPISETV